MPSEHKPTPTWQKAFLVVVFSVGGLAMLFNKPKQPADVKASAPPSVGGLIAGASSAQPNPPRDLRSEAAVQRACTDALKKQLRHPASLTFDQIDSVGKQGDTWGWQANFTTANDQGVNDKYTLRCAVRVDASNDSTHPTATLIDLAFVRSELAE